MLLVTAATKPLPKRNRPSCSAAPPPIRSAARSTSTKAVTAIDAVITPKFRLGSTAATPNVVVFVLLANAAAAPFRSKLLATAPPSSRYLNAFVLLPAAAAYPFRSVPFRFASSSFDSRPLPSRLFVRSFVRIVPLRV